MTKVLVAFACLGFFTGVLSGPALGQAESAKSYVADPTALLEPAWGTASEMSYYVGAAAFLPTVNDNYIVDDGYGAAYLYYGGPGTAWAPINLPQGALITGYDFYYLNQSTSAEIQCTLREVDSTGSFSAIGPVIGGRTSGVWTSASHNLSPPYWTVNNTSNSCQAVVMVGSEMWNDFLRWRGVRVRYKLQVSPSPSVATFSDVPLGDARNKFVEALYASGITAGCGGGKFCPDSPLTRGQMAVFLSVALGLHWQ